MTTLRFEKDFTTPPAIPPAGQEAAMALLKTGQLHRYGSGDDPVSSLEKRFAKYVNAEYCLACASGGAAMRLALRALGIGPGDKVLTNAFTLQPVPGAIAALGAEPILVATTEDLTIDLNDLEKAAEESGARTLLLSHMRGHIVDMELLMAQCDTRGINVVEDCAHTMGAYWDGRASGQFGVIACYSMQSYKHVNCGEGGLITTNEPELAADMMLMSGCYHFYDAHGAAPYPATLRKRSADLPNISARLDRLRAAIALPQIDLLDQRRTVWRGSYDVIAGHLQTCHGVALPVRSEFEDFVGSSLQFRLPNWPAAQISALVDALAERGVMVKWFGDKPKGFTSTHQHWAYVPRRALGDTDQILRELLDIRIPLSFTLEDCDIIGRILVDQIARTKQEFSETA